MGTKCVCGKKWSMSGLSSVVNAALEEGRKHVSDGGTQVGVIVAQVQIQDLVQKVERGLCLKCAVANVFEATDCPQIRAAMTTAVSSC